MAPTLVATALLSTTPAWAHGGGSVAKKPSASELEPGPAKRLILDVQKKAKDAGHPDSLLAGPMGEALGAAERRARRTGGWRSSPRLVARQARPAVGQGCRYRAPPVAAETAAETEAARLKELTTKLERAETLLSEQQARLGRLQAELDKAQGPLGSEVAPLAKPPAGNKPPAGKDGKRSETRRRLAVSRGVRADPATDKLGDVDRVRAAPATVQAKSHAPAAFANAEKLRRDAHAAFDNEDLAGGVFWPSRRWRLMPKRWRCRAWRAAEEIRLSARKDADAAEKRLALADAELQRLNAEIAALERKLEIFATPSPSRIPAVRATPVARPRAKRRWPRSASRRACCAAQRSCWRNRSSVKAASNDPPS